MLSYLKSVIRDQLGVPPWAVLVAVGCIAHVVLNAALRRPSVSAWGLLGPLVLGVLLEGYEIWLHYRNIGLLAPGNDALIAILGRHGLDVGLMLCGPFLMVVFGAVSAK